MPSTSNHVSFPFRRLARAAIAVAWAGVIFAASSRPDLRVSDDDLTDLILRKLAHMLVFGVLAVLVARAITLAGPSRLRVLAAAWLLTLAYAASDEWHQTFVQGRAGAPRDVAIDMLGATIALVLLHLHGTRHRTLQETSQ
jgi:hypothetical protein